MPSLENDRSTDVRNYRVLTQGGSMRIDQHKTLKDLYDVLVLTVPGAACLALATVLARRQFEDFNWIGLLVLVAFGLVGAYWCADGLTRLLYPTKAVVCVDREKGTVLLRRIGWRRSLSLDDIDRVELRGRVERYRFGGQRTSTASVRIVLVDRQGAEHPALLVNTDRFVRAADERIGTEVYGVARKIAEPLAEFIDKPRRWTGFAGDDAS